MTRLHPATDLLATEDALQYDGKLDQLCAVLPCKLSAQEPSPNSLNSPCEQVLPARHNHAHEGWASNQGQRT